MRRAEASGTYTFDGKKAKLTITDVKVPDEFKAYVAQKALDDAKKKPSELDERLEGDSLTLNPTSGSQTTNQATGGTFTRAK